MTQQSRQRTVYTRKTTTTFFITTAALTKPGHCVLSRRAKYPCFHPCTLQSRLWPMQLLLFCFCCCCLFVCFPLIRQKIVGRRFLMATGSVNSCHFRAYFPLTIVTSKKGTILLENVKVSSKSYMIIRSCFPGMVHFSQLPVSQNREKGKSVIFFSFSFLKCAILGDSGGVVNSLDFCPASLKSLGCFYFRCVLSSQWTGLTVNLRILHCNLKGIFVGP